MKPTILPSGRTRRIGVNIFRLSVVAILSCFHVGAIAQTESIRMPEIEIKGRLRPEVPGTERPRADKWDGPEAYTRPPKLIEKPLPQTAEQIAEDAQRKREREALEALRRELAEIVKVKPESPIVDFIKTLIEKLLEKGLGKLSWITDLLSSESTGRDYFDHAKNYSELNKIHDLLMKEKALHLKMIEQAPKDYEKNMQFFFPKDGAEEARNIHYRDPASDELANLTSEQRERYKLEKAFVKYIAVRSPTMGVIADEAIRRQREGSSFPLSESMATRLWKISKLYVPANMCLTSRKPGCELNGDITQRAGCMCPPLLTDFAPIWREGFATFRQPGNLCKTPIATCRLPRDAPKGTECYCPVLDSLRHGLVVSKPN